VPRAPPLHARRRHPARQREKERERDRDRMRDMERERARHIKADLEQRDSDDEREPWQRRSLRFT
jgi:hypothetical protein